ncbi:hypothetical protein HDV05_006057 [Chytridiales sp. JEL 0842]|nr:hypothetical protein HDV05_006057 [Chytridiales sp. JEL 0842]
MMSQGYHDHQVGTSVAGAAPAAEDYSGNLNLGCDTTTHNTNLSHHHHLDGPQLALPDAASFSAFQDVLYPNVEQFEDYQERFEQQPGPTFGVPDQVSGSADHLSHMNTDSNSSMISTTLPWFLNQAQSLQTPYKPSKNHHRSESLYSIASTSSTGFKDDSSAVSASPALFHPSASRSAGGHRRTDTGYASFTSKGSTSPAVSTLAGDAASLALDNNPYVSILQQQGHHFQPVAASHEVSSMCGGFMDNGAARLSSAMQLGEMTTASLMDAGMDPMVLYAMLYQQQAQQQQHARQQHARQQQLQQQLEQQQQYSQLAASPNTESMMSDMLSQSYPSNFNNTFPVASKPPLAPSKVKPSSSLPPLRHVPPSIIHPKPANTPPKAPTPKQLAELYPPTTPALPKSFAPQALLSFHHGEVLHHLNVLKEHGISNLSGSATSSSSSGPTPTAQTNIEPRTTTSFKLPTYTPLCKCNTSTSQSTFQHQPTFPSSCTYFDALRTLVHVFGPRVVKVLDSQGLGCVHYVSSVLEGSAEVRRCLGFLRGCWEVCDAFERSEMEIERQVRIVEEGSGKRHSSLKVGDGVRCGVESVTAQGAGDDDEGATLVMGKSTRRRKAGNTTSKPSTNKSGLPPLKKKSLQQQLEQDQQQNDPTELQQPHVFPDSASILPLALRRDPRATSKVSKNYFEGFSSSSEEEVDDGADDLNKKRNARRRKGRAKFDDMEDSEDEEVYIASDDEDEEEDDDDDGIFDEADDAMDVDRPKKMKRSRTAPTSKRRKPAAIPAPKRSVKSTPAAASAPKPAPAKQGARYNPATPAPTAASQGKTVQDLQYPLPHPLSLLQTHPNSPDSLSNLPPLSLAILSGNLEGCKALIETLNASPFHCGVQHLPKPCGVSFPTQTSTASPVSWIYLQNPASTLWIPGDPRTAPIEIGLSLVLENPQVFYELMSTYWTHVQTWHDTRKVGSPQPGQTSNVSGIPQSSGYKTFGMTTTMYVESGLPPGFASVMGLIGAPKGFGDVGTLMGTVRFSPGGDVVGDTPLHRVLGSKMKDSMALVLAKALLETYSCSLLTQDSQGFTPLHLAALRSRSPKFFKSLMSLPTSQAHAPAVSIAYAKTHSPFASATWNLQNAGWDLTTFEVALLVPDKIYHRTPFHWAAACSRSLPLLEMFRAYAPLLDPKDSKGRTPLMLAAMNGWEDGARYLQGQGAEAGMRDYEGKGARELYAMHKKSRTGMLGEALEQIQAGLNDVAVAVNDVDEAAAAGTGGDGDGMIDLPECWPGEEDGMCDGFKGLAGTLGTLVTTTFVDSTPQESVRKNGKRRAASAKERARKAGGWRLLWKGRGW